MKKTFFYFVIAAIIIEAINLGCKSPSEKAADAQSKVDVAKLDLSVRKACFTDAQKALNNEAWKTFRDRAQIKIKNNETRIEGFKNKIKNQVSITYPTYELMIDSLELKNKELVTRMDNYSLDKSNWEVFKLQFNRDLNSIGVALDNLTYKGKEQEKMLSN